MWHNQQMSNINNNPLKPAILQILRTSKSKLAIHELLPELKRVSRIPNLHNDAQLALFRLNWMMMNALYQLQLDFIDDGLLLTVSTLDIHLSSLPENSQAATEQDLSHQPLRNYYLDWDNFSETTVEEVKAMLEGVWQDYISTDDQHKAYETLGLNPSTDKRTIRITYRKLAHQYHPDKGGDSEKFMAIRHAYEILKKSQAN